MSTHKNIVFYTVLVLLLGMLIHCKPDKPVDREAVRKEMASRELKRISEGELMAKGEEVGSQVLSTVEGLFRQRLTKAIETSSAKGAISYCNTEAMQVIEKLEDSLGISIRRVTDRPRNPADSLTGIEKEIWEAYNFSPQNATAQLQILNEHELIMTKPIVISDVQCLKCHGDVDIDIDSETYDLIRQQYPEDQATGYDLGALRGMWSLMIPKRTIVKEL